MYILRKRPQKLKNITFLHFMTTFRSVALKVEIGRAATVFKPVLETRTVNDVYHYV